MTTTAQAAAPTITNAATKATTPHKLFVSVPVNDLQQSIRFFEALGFAFNQQFTDASGTCMLVGEDAYVMLLDKSKFTGLSKRPIGNVRTESNALFALSVNSRAEVDEMVKKAAAAGGSHADDAEDHGFMYDWGFVDLDGHQWGVFWMDPSAVPG